MVKLSRLHKKLLFALMLMAVTLALSGQGLAQLSTASVSGIVQDTTGARIPNAKIVLQNTLTSVTNTTISNGAGVYSFFSLNPGHYTLMVTVSGFRPKRVPEFILTVAQAATINFDLAVGSAGSTVTVQGANPELQTSSASLGTVVSSKQVNDLPLNGRNFTELLILTPGVAPTSTGQNASGWLSSAANGSTVSFPEMNGQSSRSNLFYTDGLFNSSEFISMYAVPPIIDAIQEFKVVSHTDDAQFGGATGGIIDVTTKSGTNQLHGTAWEYARNAIFDADNNYFDPGAPKIPFSQNQFGGSIGGPVWLPKLYHGRNKTFFFGAYQGFRWSQVGNTLFHVPTAANYAGDLSDWPTQIYNPFTTRPDPANPGQYIGDPFPGNQIPASMIDQGLVTYAKFGYPNAGPVLDAAGDNAEQNTPSTQVQNEWDIRVDQKIGANDSAFFRYSAANDTNVGGLLNNPSVNQQPSRNWGLSYTHVFNQSLVLQGLFSHTTVPQDNYNFYTDSYNGISKTSVVAALNLAPAIVTGWVGQGTKPLLFATSMGLYSGLPGDYYTSNLMTDDWQYSVNIMKTIKGHALHFGGSYITMRFAAITNFPEEQFAAQNTADPNLNDAVNRGDPLASYLLGVPSGYEFRNNEAVTRPGGVASGYAQDSWKVTPKLTVNYGLRYDVTFIPQEGRNYLTPFHGGPYIGDMDYSNGTYLVQKLPPACNVSHTAPCIPGDGTLPAHVVVSPNDKIFQNDYGDISPRFAFAYQIGNNMVVRGGYGLSYDNWTAIVQIVSNNVGTWPDVGALDSPPQLNLPTSASPTPTVTATNPLSITGTGGANVLPAATPWNVNFFFADPNIKMPRAQQWNIGIERALGSGTSLTINYVGMKSDHLDVGGSYNTALTPGPGDPSSRSLYPYMGVSGWDRPVGEGNYNGLQTSLIKRYADGWSYSVSYTWSKTINDGTDGWFGSEGGTPQDPYKPAAYGSRSVAGFDSTNVLAVSTLYAVPIGRGMRFSTDNRALDYILGHWQFNNIFTAETGFPYTVVAGADIANIGGGTEYANRVGNPSGPKTTAEWFNTAAFAEPQAYTFGNSGRNSLRSPDIWDWDASIFRTIPVGGDRQFQFRVEAFNVPNHVILGQPDANLADGPRFGTINYVQNIPRQIQLALKFIF